MKKSTIYSPVLVAFTGGLDSTVLLAETLSLGWKPVPILFRYGSKQDEIQERTVREICNYYSLSPQIVDLPPIMVSNNAMKQGDKKIPDEIKSSTVPCRNLIFISMLANIAENNGIKKIFMGIQDSINTQYLDCGDVFVRDISKVVWSITDEVWFDAPYMFSSKDSIIIKGKELDVPFHLTRSCYLGQDEACGKCPACEKRLAAFARAEMTDPIRYKK